MPKVTLFHTQAAWLLGLKQAVCQTWARLDVFFPLSHMNKSQIYTHIKYKLFTCVPPCSLCKPALPGPHLGTALPGRDGALLQSMQELG